MKKIIAPVLIVVFVLGAGGFLYSYWLGSKKEAGRDLIREAREEETAPVEEPAPPSSQPVTTEEPVQEDEPTTLPDETAVSPMPEPEPQPQPESQPQPSEPSPPSAQGVQEFEIVETIYPGKFDPSQITVKRGVPVKIYLTTTQREHINRVSILPYITSSDTILPGKVTILEFTPLEVGDLEIRNIGHGFTGTIKVTD